MVFERVPTTDLTIHWDRQPNLGPEVRCLNSPGQWEFFVFHGEVRRMVYRRMQRALRLIPLPPLQGGGWDGSGTSYARRAQTVHTDHT